MQANNDTGTDVDETTERRGIRALLESSSEIADCLGEQDMASKFAGNNNELFHILIHSTSGLLDRLDPPPICNFFLPLLESLI